MEFTSTRRVLCSEFILKTTLQCLDLLDKELKEELKDTLTDPQKDLIIPPVQERRRLHRIVPGNLEQRVQDTQVVTFQEHPAILKKLVEFNQYNLMDK